MIERSSRARGFTMIEVLVTLVILMFGMLGIAGMMVKGQRAAFDAYQRQQALALGNDIAERIRANRAQGAIYAASAAVATPVGTGARFNDLVLGALTDCRITACTSVDLAAFDLAMWDGVLAGGAETALGQAVGGIINARGCVEAAPAPAPANALRVSVAWQGNDETAAAVTSACGTGLYATENRRRVVSMDLLLP